MIKCIAVVAVMTLPASAVAQGMTPADEAAFQSRLESWAKTYFPAVVEETHPPKDLLLGFLVDRTDRVLKHSVAIQSPPPVAVADELKRMFPERQRSELIRNGAACFFRPNTTQKHYCVVYAEVGK